jgi:hypothetical protein
MRVRVNAASGIISSPIPAAAIHGCMVFGRLAAITAPGILILPFPEYDSHTDQFSPFTRRQQSDELFRGSQRQILSQQS